MNLLTITPGLGIIVFVSLPVGVFMNYCTVNYYGSRLETRTRLSITGSLMFLPTADSILPGSLLDSRRLAIRVYPLGNNLEISIARVVIRL